MTIKLIGLAGKAGTGKDTAADHLCEQHGFARYAFADPIRAALQAAFGLAQEAFTDRETKEQPLEPFGVSPRRMMQTLGTEWGRKIIHPELWLLLAEQNIRWLAMNGSRRIVISDVRFNNEANWIRAQGGAIVHIYRPCVAGVTGHVSEDGVTPTDRDVYIVNDATINDLHTALDAVLPAL